MGLFAIIVCLAVVIFVVGNNKDTNKNEKIEPPTEDAAYMGCMMDCGYYSQEFYKDSNGKWEMSPDKGYCSYQNQIVKWGVPCQFAKDHPEQLKKGLFQDDLIDIEVE